MSCANNSSNVNETFIIEPFVAEDIYTTSAKLIGKTIYFDRIDMLSAYTANLSSFTTTDYYVTGGTYSNGTAIFTNNSGSTFSVTGFSTSTATAFTGGTVTGATIFTNGLTANTISATTYQNVAHSGTTGLQGGSAGEYYHLTASQQNRVLNLIYSGQVTTFSIAPTTAERGTATTVTASYRMIAGDDIYTGATINPLGYNLYPDFTDGTPRTTGFTQAASASTTTYTLNYGYTRNGVGNAAAASATFTTYLPQWCGVNVAFSAVTTYAAVSALGLTKIVSSSASQSMTPIANNQYIWFISNKSNATITQGGLPTAISNLNVEDGVSDFYLKSFTLTLANGITTGALYTYISRQSKTLTGVLYTIA
jgi:hypothetical protein